MFVHITETQKNLKIFPVHTHEVWEYMCYEEGTGVLRTEDGDIPFKAGTVLVVPPNSKHGSCGDDYFKNICIHTDFSMGDMQKLYIPLASKELRDLFGVVSCLYKEKEKNSFAIELLLSVIKDLILKEVERSYVVDTLSFVHGEIVKKYADSEFDLGKLIEQSGYVDDVFRVKFKRAYGVTPKEFLDNLRMHAAKEFLRIYGDVLSIKEIGTMCGIKDSLYFSRKFKRKFGVSPKLYKKENNLV